MVHGGYDGNTAVVDHIWDNLYAKESNNVIENVVGQAPDQQTDQREILVPQIHPDWLNDKEKSQRDEKYIRNEVLRRLVVERADGQKRENNQLRDVRPPTTIPESAEFEEDELAPE